MAGLYIHIPFCKTRCGYCDFHTSTGLALMKPLVDAICLEIARTKDFIANTTIETIYFGGGTPSLLPGNLIAQILNQIFNVHSVLNEAEITIEANPDDLNDEKLLFLKSLPINRLSIGVQSLSNAELKLMNRRHNSIQAMNAIERACRYGFDNISFDLIYGIPGQSLESWSNSLELSLKLPVQHLSSYALTYEEGTPFFERVKNKRMTPLDDELNLNMFKLLIEKTKAAGFNQYEVSNFAKSGRESRHNSSYWNGKPYIGIGPSAHSYNGEIRRWNISDNSTYINAINNNTNCFELEQLDETIKYNEYIITRMRTMNGCNTQDILTQFGAEKVDYFKQNAQKFINTGTLIEKNDVVSLTENGIFISDRIMSDLIYV